MFRTFFSLAFILSLGTGKADLIIPGSELQETSFIIVEDDTSSGFMKRIHTVVKGEWLSRIAWNYYGDALMWGVIYKSNKDKIKDPNLIYPGQEFYLPLIEPENKSIKNEVTEVKPVTRPEDIKQPLRVEDIEFQGFIVDETQSKWGKDFYESYYNQVQTGISAKNFTIVVSEKPLPRLGSQVSIKINDNEIFQQFIQPKQEYIDEIAEWGAAYTKDYITNYEEIEKSLHGEDLKGTGIF